MKTLLVIFASFLLVACYRPVPATPKGRFYEALLELNTATTDEGRFYALTTLSKEAFVLGKYSDARKYALQLEALVPKFKGNWNYGNAIQDFNIVLGRLAVKDGNIKKASIYLLAAGHSPGSPQMDSFGPNMSLAKELLDQGEIKSVIEYFDLCRSFWKMDRGRLDLWTKEAQSGKTPNFDANLIY